MGTATTFNDLQDQLSRKVIPLLRIQLGRALPGWSATSGKVNTWELDATGLPFFELSEDGAVLTLVASLNDVEAQAGSWWLDPTSETLYAHATGSGDPGDQTMVGQRYLYVSDRTINVGGNWYIPRLRALPEVRQVSDSPFFGVATISVGNIDLINNDGYFDSLTKQDIWENQPVRVQVGGDDLPEGEYQTIASAIIRDREWSEQSLALIMGDALSRFQRRIPTDEFETTTYPNLESRGIGRKIPLAYGSFTSTRAPIVTCVDTATNKFIIANHGIESVQQVEKSTDGGVTWSNVSHAAEDLAEASFTITTYDSTVDLVRVQFNGKEASLFLGIWEPDSGESGTSAWAPAGIPVYDDASTTERNTYGFWSNPTDPITGAEGTLKNGSSIIYDLLVTYGGFDAGELNITKFQEAEAAQSLGLAVWIEDEFTLLEIINKVCDSMMGMVYVDNDGDVALTSWEPEAGSGVPSIDEQRILGRVRVTTREEILRRLVRVGYAANNSSVDPRQSFKQVTDSSVTDKFKVDRSITLETFIVEEADAATLASRLSLVYGSVSQEISLTTDLTGATLGLTETFTITSARGPTVSGAWSSTRYRVFGITKDPASGRVTILANDLSNLGGGSGFWMDGTAPVYTAATSAEREDSGFWTDANGLADTSDPDSGNASKWF